MKTSFNRRLRSITLALVLTGALFMTCCQISGPRGDPALKIAAGSYHTLALKSDGSVWAWGHNNYGQLGDGTTTDSSIPLEVLNLAGVTAIAAGRYHTVALKTDGSVWAWGYNGHGQLGDGTNDNENTPVQVTGFDGSGWLSDVAAIAAVGDYTIALKTDGSVWAWGDNGLGQLGDGTNDNKNTPVQVKGPGGVDWLADVFAIAAGGYHTVALKTDGSVWAWGNNTTGQLGDGTNDNKNTPVQVKGAGGSGWLTDVTAIGAGWHHTMALKTDGSVWAWGDNTTGQLGDGTTDNKNTPVQVKGADGSGWLSDITAIAAGSGHTMALKSDGSVWAWGDNDYGQLGDNTITDSTTPVQTVEPLILW